MRCHPHFLDKEPEKNKKNCLELRHSRKTVRRDLNDPHPQCTEEKFLPQKATKLFPVQTVEDFPIVLFFLFVLGTLSLT